MPPVSMLEVKSHVCAQARPKSRPSNRSACRCSPPGNTKLLKGKAEPHNAFIQKKHDKGRMRDRRGGATGGAWTSSTDDRLAACTRSSCDKHQQVLTLGNGTRLKSSSHVLQIGLSSSARRLKLCPPFATGLQCHARTAAVRTHATRAP